MRQYTDYNIEDPQSKYEKLRCIIIINDPDVPDFAAYCLSKNKGMQEQSKKIEGKKEYRTYMALFGIVIEFLFYFSLLVEVAVNAPSVSVYMVGWPSMNFMISCYSFTITS